MAQIHPIQQVKLFVVTLHRDPAILQLAFETLQSEFGPTDFISKDFPFDVTDYYEDEMGAGLARRFYSFERLIPPEAIVEIKRLTNTLEDKLAKNEKREINLDPGYLDEYKVVLASAKFGGQKVYLRDGIYADITLVRYKGKWDSFPWGFPDFKSGIYDETLTKIRDLFKTQKRARSHQQ